MRTRLLAPRDGAGGVREQLRVVLDLVEVCRVVVGDTNLITTVGSIKVRVALRHICTENAHQRQQRLTLQALLDVHLAWPSPTLGGRRIEAPIGRLYLRQGDLDVVPVAATVDVHLPHRQELGVALGGHELTVRIVDTVVRGNGDLSPLLLQRYHPPAIPMAGELCDPAPLSHSVAERHGEQGEVGLHHLNTIGTYENPSLSAIRLERLLNGGQLDPMAPVDRNERFGDDALGGEIDHRVDAAGDVADQLAVADVAVDEGVARIALDVLQVRRVARVGELVEVDDGVVGARREDVSNEVRADEAAPARDEQLHPPSPASRPTPTRQGRCKMTSIARPEGGADRSVRGLARDLAHGQHALGMLRTDPATTENEARRRQLASPLPRVTCDTSAPASHPGR